MPLLLSGQGDAVIRELVCLFRAFQAAEARPRQAGAGALTPVEGPPRVVVDPLGLRNALHAGHPELYPRGERVMAFHWGTLGHSLGCMTA